MSDELEIADSEHIEKHNLQYPWTFWYFKPKSAVKTKDEDAKWLDNFSQICDFTTVEDFWALYNHVAPPSELLKGSDYYVFKKGIEPMWEDKQCSKGGRWVLCLSGGPGNTSQIDKFWLQTLLVMIGEGFNECSSQILGAVINRRPGSYKVGLWTRDKDDEDSIRSIGNTLKEKLNLGTEKLKFEGFW